MSDKSVVHRGSSFRGLLSPRNGENPANPPAGPMTAAPTFPVDRLPGAILANIVGFLRSEQSERDFLCDVRSFSLVSRHAAASVKGFAGTDNGNLLEWAAKEYEPKRAFAKAASRTKKKTAFNLAKKLIEKIDHKPPAGLIKVAKQYGRFEIRLGASPTDDTVYDALYEWGDQLPLTSIRISCGMNDYPVLTSSEQVIAHLTLATKLLARLGWLRLEKLDRMEIHVVGPATGDKEGEEGLHRAIDKLVSTASEVTLLCLTSGERLPDHPQRCLDQARRENFDKMMSKLASNRL